MDALQQLKQPELNLETAPQVRTDFSSEAFIAKRLAESPTGQVRLLESILERTNMRTALRRVLSNDGAPGVDGMTCRQLCGYLKRCWPTIRQALLDGTYTPQPVKRCEIPKPDGGVRLLGIPAALDRLIQQAVAQVLTHLWDHTFSDSSHGFRPGRSQRGALTQCRAHVQAGYRVAVDLDLSKFFDRVNHDRLMSRLAARIADKRVLHLIRRYLTSGVMIGGLVEATSQQHRPRRTGQRAGEPKSALRAVCRRLRHLCQEHPRGGTSDGKRDALHREEAALESQPG